MEPRSLAVMVSLAFLLLGAGQTQVFGQRRDQNTDSQLRTGNEEQSKIASYLKSIEILTGELSRLTDALTAKDVTIAKLEEDSKRLQAQIGTAGSLERDLRRLRTQLASEIDKRKAHEEENERTSGALREKDQQLSLLRSQIVDASREAQGDAAELVHRRERNSMYALLVGISSYQYKDRAGLTELESAAGDARSFAQVLVNNFNWSPDNIYTLTNEQATLRNIKYHLEDKLGLAEEDDLIVLFWAGHGYGHPNDPQKVYFACHDTEYNKPSTGLEMSEVRDRIKRHGTKNVVSILDTCHSGAFMTTRDSERGMEVRVQKAVTLDIPEGWIYFAGAESDDVAFEIATLPNGLFTHYLLKGLSGAADGVGRSGHGDSRVTMGELKDFMEQTARRESLDKYGIRLDPLIHADSWKSEVWELDLGAR